MEQQIINNGESGLSVRNKINGMFANLISGSEGINAIWKQIGINLNYTAEIGNVETLNATSKAWGEIYITGKKFVFNFGIPRGYDGGMIIIRKTYSSVAEMNADKNPMGDDGIAIGGGQIVSVFNSSNPDENAFYSRTANGWKMQLGVVKEFRDEMTSQVNSVKQKADESKANIQNLVNALPVTQTTGDSTTSVMSQKAVTDDILTRANCYIAYGVFNGSYVWSSINTNNIHLVIDVSELNPSVLRYYTNVSSRLAFCKSYKKPVLNESLDYVVEGGSFIGLSPGADVVSIPEGTKIIILQTKLNGNNAMPEHLYINGFDFTQSIKKNMSVRFANDDELNANNLLTALVYGDTIPLISGKFLATSGISMFADSASYITDYIKVNPAVDYYYTGKFGGATAGAQFFSDFNTIVGNWSESNLARHTNEKVVFPAGTKYVRFSSFQGSLIVTAKLKIQENTDEELSNLDTLQKISDNVFINNGAFASTPLIWFALNDNNKHIVIDVSAFNGENIVYRYSKVNGARMAFLESYNTPVPNAELDVVDGTALVGIKSGVDSVSIPEGTKYVVLQTLFNGMDVLPDSFCINGIDLSLPLKATIAKIGMECNNQSAKIDSLNIVNGLEIKKNKGWYLKASGFGENDEADSYASDYIKIDNNARYYYTGVFGGNCAGAQFFSDIDVFISAWTDSALSKRTNAPVPVPSNAKYVRFSSFRRDFSISSTKHFLSIDNFDINPIFNELTIDKDVDFVNGIFDILVFKARYNSILNVYVNGVMVRYKLNSATVWEYYLVKNYGTQEEAEDNLEALATYTIATPSSRFTISYSVNWDKVTSGVTEFKNIKLNPNFVKRLPKFDSPISLGTRDVKRILWLGTSIPAGGYPEMVGAILGCKVYNEAVGESLCRLGWGAGCIKEGDTIDIWGCDINTHVANPASNTITALAKSLSASKAEKQYLLDNLAHFEEVTQTTLNRTRYTDDVIMSFSYEDKILKYVDSSRNDYTPVDLIVFDHGHNDIVPDGVPAWDTYSLTNTNKDNYWGAMNFLLDVIKKYQPNIAICQVSHYYGWENYTGSSIDEKIWDAQKQIADYNGMVFCPLYKLTGYSSRRMLRTNGYWSQNGIWHNSGFSYLINQDGTISTNSYTIARLYKLDGTWSNQIFTSNGQNIPSIVSGREIGQKTGESEVNYNIRPRDAAFPDGLHPHSDTSTKALKKIATLLAGWLKGTYCM